MAGSFDLTAEIGFRSPTLNREIERIRKQLAGIVVPVSFDLSGSAKTDVKSLARNLGVLNGELKQVAINATNARDAVIGISVAFRNFNKASQIDAADKKLQSLYRSARQATTQLKQLSSTGDVKIRSPRGSNQNVDAAKSEQGLQKIARATRAATTEVEEFGRISGLALRRNAGFVIATGAVFGFTRAVTEGFSAAIKFQTQVAKIAQVSGTSIGAVKDLSDKITRLSIDLGVASEELIEVALTLAQADLSLTETKQALEALAKTSLAATFGDISDTTEGLIAILNQFGIQAKESEEALGSVNAVAAAFAVESGDIISAVKRAGGVFAALSKDINTPLESLNEFIALFTSVRATTRESADTIATGLRVIFSRLQRPQTIEFLRQIGVELTDLEGKFVGPFEAISRLSERLQTLDARSPLFARVIEELSARSGQAAKIIPLLTESEKRIKALQVAQEGQDSLTRDSAIAQQTLANQLVKTAENFRALIREIAETDSFRVLVQSILTLTNALTGLARATTPILPIIGALALVKGASVGVQFLSGITGGLRRGRGFATGGMVTGPSGPDQVPARLTAGEFVLNKKTVENIGATNLEVLNRGGSPPIIDMLEPQVQKLETGGLIKESQNILINKKINKNRNTSENKDITANEIIFTEQSVKSIGSDVLDEVNKSAIQRASNNKFIDRNTEIDTTLLNSRKIDNVFVKRQNFVDGGLIKGQVGDHKVPDKLTAGEFVLSDETVEKIGAKNLKLIHDFAKSSNFGGGGVVRQRLGDGGPVKGPTGKDEVPANLTRGEFVFSKKAVDNIGEKNLQTIQKFAKTKTQSFETGGKVQSPQAVKEPKRFAVGGMVTGPGGIDKVPANLTAGEFVVKKDSVRKIGLDKLRTINETGNIENVVQNIVKGGRVTNINEVDEVIEVNRGGLIRRQNFQDGGFVQRARAAGVNVPTFEELYPNITPSKLKKLTPEEIEKRANFVVSQRIKEQKKIQSVQKGLGTRTRKVVTRRQTEVESSLSGLLGGARSPSIELPPAQVERIADENTAVEIRKQDFENRQAAARRSRAQLAADIETKQPSSPSATPITNRDREIQESVVKNFESTSRDFSNKVNRAREFGERSQRIAGPNDLPAAGLFNIDDDNDDIIVGRKPQTIRRVAAESVQRIRQQGIQGAERLLSQPVRFTQTTEQAKKLSGRTEDTAKALSAWAKETNRARDATSDLVNEIRGETNRRTTPTRQQNLFGTAGDDENFVRQGGRQVGGGIIRSTRLPSSDDALLASIASGRGLSAITPRDRREGFKPVGGAKISQADIQTILNTTVRTQSRLFDRSRKQAAPAPLNETTLLTEQIERLNTQTRKQTEIIAKDTRIRRSTSIIDKIPFQLPFLRAPRDVKQVRERERVNIELEEQRARPRGQRAPEGREPSEFRRGIGPEVFGGSTVRDPSVRFEKGQGGVRRVPLSPEALGVISSFDDIDDRPRRQRSRLNRASLIGRQAIRDTGAFISRANTQFAESRVGRNLTGNRALIGAAVVGVAGQQIGGRTGDTITGAASGAAIGSLAGPVGTVVGAITGAFLSFINSGVDKKIADITNRLNASMSKVEDSFQELDENIKKRGFKQAILDTRTASADVRESALEKLTVSLSDSLIPTKTFFGEGRDPLAQVTSNPFNTLSKKQQDILNQSGRDLSKELEPAIIGDTDIFDRLVKIGLTAEDAFSRLSEDQKFTVGLGIANKEGRQGEFIRGALQNNTSEFASSQFTDSFVKFSTDFIEETDNIVKKTKESAEGERILAEAREAANQGVHLLAEQFLNFSAVLDRVSQISVPFQRQNEALLSRRSGGAGIISRQVQNVFENPKAFTEKEITKSTREIVGQGGFGDIVIAVNNLEKNLPRVLNNLNKLQQRNSGSIGTLLRPTIDKEFSGLPKVFRDRLEQDIKSRVGTAKNNQPDALKNLLNAGDASQLTDGISGPVNDSMRKFVDIFNKNTADLEKELNQWISLNREANQSFDDINSIRLESAVTAKQLQGDRLTVEDRTAVSDAQIRALGIRAGIDPDSKKVKVERLGNFGPLIPIPGQTRNFTNDPDVLINREQRLANTLNPRLEKGNTNFLARERTFLQDQNPLNAGAIDTLTAKLTSQQQDATSTLRAIANNTSKQVALQADLNTILDSRGQARQAIEGFNASNPVEQQRTLRQVRLARQEAEGGPLLRSQRADAAAGRPLLNAFVGATQGPEGLEKLDRQFLNALNNNPDSRRLAEAAGAGDNIGDFVTFFKNRDAAFQDRLDKFIQAGAERQRAQEGIAGIDRRDTNQFLKTGQDAFTTAQQALFNPEGLLNKLNETLGNIPSEIKIGGKIDVNLSILGGEVLGAIGPAMEKLIARKIEQQIASIFPSDGPSSKQFFRPISN